MQTTWEDNRKLITSLWTNYEPSDAERDLVARRFGAIRRQDWLRQAIESHRLEDASGRYKPAMNDILDRFNAIANSGSASERAEKVEAGGVWCVGRWRDYKPYGDERTIRTLVTSRERFASEREAMATGCDEAIRLA